MKIKLIFSYDGSRFQGSATQPHLNSVQDTLAQALKRLGITQKPLFASRTDKGVHSLGAVACVRCGGHFDDLNALKARLNHHAHPNIHIKRIEKVGENFQVRFDAKAREYRYLLHHGEFSPFLSPYFYFYPRFDLGRANAILSHFEGTFDFKNFSKQCEKNSIRTMTLANAYAHGDISVFRFRANGFLRAQIRLIVAAVLKVLSGKMSESVLLRQLGEKIECENFDFYPKNSRNLQENLRFGDKKNSIKNSQIIDTNFQITAKNSRNFNEKIKCKKFQIFDKKTKCENPQILYKKTQSEKILNEKTQKDKDLQKIKKEFCRVLVPPNGLYLTKIFY